MKKTSKFQAKLYEGGEAEIYRLDATHLAKVYKPHVDKASKLKKLEALLAMSLPNNVASPIDLLFDKIGAFIGFSMQEITGKTISNLSNRKFITSLSINKKHIARILVGLHCVLDELHAQLSVGDLNDMNILFDGNSVFLVDVDSWHLPGFPCEVSHPLFVDPLLRGTDFSTRTDNYAYAVLAFKSLTRLHPFGGTYGKMSILARIKNRISVFHDNVIIPKIVDKWDFIPSNVNDMFRKIFEGDVRDAIDLTTFADNALLCHKHNDYYYGYSICPVCFDVTPAPTKLPPSAIKCKIMVQDDNIRIIFARNCCLMKDDTMYFPTIKKSIPFDQNSRYYLCGDVVVIDSDREFNIGGLVVNKLHNSRIIVGDFIYYVSPARNLVEIALLPNGITEMLMCECSFRNVYNVYNEEHFFVCNIYNDAFILTIDNYTYKLNEFDGMTNWGMHFDSITDQWLFIYTNQLGKTITYVFDKNKIIFVSDSINYSGELDRVCYNRGTIYIPSDGEIIGYNHGKNVYKTFTVPVVTSDSKIEKSGSKMIVINETEIYQLSSASTTPA